MGCAPCGEPSTVNVGLRPIVEVTDVTVDGAAVPASAIAWDKQTGDIYRTDGTPWPASQDLSIESGEGAWSITLTYGRNPPRMGIEAAKLLACEVLRAITPGAAGGECALPPNVSSMVRQGVTFDFDRVNTATEQSGGTGIWLVDAFVRLHNPNGLARTSAVYSPDIHRPARIVTY